MSILSLLGKAGKRVFSPATQARNIASGGQQVLSPATQVRNLESAAAFKRAQGMARKAKNESLRHAEAVYEDALRRGVVNTNVRKEDLMRKMDQYLSREYELYSRRAPTANFLEFPKELIRSLGDKAVWIALGAGGIAGYKTAENKAKNEALQQMEEETQIGPVEGYFKDVGFGERDWESGGKATANLLMDIISPIPRQ
jgi:hypothetical protein